MEDLPEVPEASRVDALAASFGEHLRDEIERDASGGGAPKGGMRARLKLPAVFWALQRTFGAVSFPYSLSRPACAC